MRIDASYAPTGETVLAFVEDIMGQELRIHTPLRVAGHLPGLTGDRLAIAVALLLGQAVGDRLDVGKPVSRRVARAVGTYLTKPAMWVGPDEEITYLHSAGVDMHLSDSADLSRHVVGGIPDRRSMTLVELPNHVAAGSLLTAGNWVVATNSWARYSTDPAARLAVPVLLAHSISASRLVVPEALGNSLTVERKAALTGLLGSTDLRLLWTEEGGSA